MPGVWIGMSDNTARQIKKIWAGKENGTAQEIRTGWVGIDGTARKIWPRYIKHFHVASGDPSTGNRDGDEDVTGNFAAYGYDTSGTVPAEYSSSKSGCFCGKGFHEHTSGCSKGTKNHYTGSYQGSYTGAANCPKCGAGVWTSDNEYGGGYGWYGCSKGDEEVYTCGDPVNRWKTSCGYKYGQTIEGND